MRALRRYLPLLLVLVAVGLLAIVLTSRPDLEDARNEVDTRWEALAAPLNARYELLAAASAAASNNVGPAGEIAAEVNAALNDWADSVDRDVADAVAAANALEGLGRRLDAAIGASPTLSNDAAVMTAMTDFATADPPEPASQFTAAVRAYEDERDGPVRGVLADALGYEPIPVLVVAAPA